MGFNIFLQINAPLSQNFICYNLHFLLAIFQNPIINYTEILQRFQVFAKKLDGWTDLGGWTNKRELLQKIQ